MTVNEYATGVLQLKTTKESVPKDKCFKVPDEEGIYDSATATSKSWRFGVSERYVKEVNRDIDSIGVALYDYRDITLIDFLSSTPDNCLYSLYYSDGTFIGVYTSNDRDKTYDQYTIYSFQKSQEIDYTIHLNKG